MIEKLKALFRRKKSSEDIEDELTEQILEENRRGLEDIMRDSILASVITYQVSGNDNIQQTIPVVLLDNFTGPVLPELGSVIWIKIEEILRPFVCVRFDYIQSDNEMDSLRLYIVVRPAREPDIISYE